MEITTAGYISKRVQISSQIKYPFGVRRNVVPSKVADPASTKRETNESDATAEGKSFFSRFKSNPSLRKPKKILSVRS